MNIFALLYASYLRQLLRVLYVRAKGYTLNCFYQKIDIPLAKYGKYYFFFIIIIHAEEEIRISRIAISSAWNIHIRRRLKRTP